MTSSKTTATSMFLLFLMIVEPSQSAAYSLQGTMPRTPTSATSVPASASRALDGSDTVRDCNSSQPESTIVFLEMPASAATLTTRSLKSIGEAGETSANKDERMQEKSEGRRKNKSGPKLDLWEAQGYRFSRTTKARLAMGLTCAGGLLLTLQPLFHSTGHVSTRQKHCPYELAHNIVDAKTKKPLEASLSTVKPCFEEWVSYEDAVTEFNGCVPGDWVSSAFAGKEVCATALGEENVAVEIGECALCDPCACTPTGRSGNVMTGLRGCQKHFQANPDLTYAPFCYVVGGDKCELPSAKASTLFPNAYFRSCDRDTDDDPLATFDPSETPNTDKNPFQKMMEYGRARGVLKLLRDTITEWKFGLFITVLGVLSFIGLQNDLSHMKKDGLNMVSPQVNMYDAHLTSLASNEWKCNDAIHTAASTMPVCKDISDVSPNTSTSMIWEVPCHNRLSNLINVYDKTQPFGSNVFETEWSCSHKCNTCHVPNDWTPVQMQGRLRSYLIYDKDQDKELYTAAAITNFSSYLVPGYITVQTSNPRDEFETEVITITDKQIASTSRGVLSDLYPTLFSPIDEQGDFKFTMSVYPSSNVPSMRIIVYAPDVISRRVYDIYMNGHHQGRRLN